MDTYEVRFSFVNAHDLTEIRIMEFKAESELKAWAKWRNHCKDNKLRRVKFGKMTKTLPGI